MEQTLLEYLVNQVGCMYISDLPSIKYRAKILKALSRAPLPDYPQVQWDDMVSYLVKKDVAFSSPREAIQFLAKENGC